MSSQQGSLAQEKMSTRRRSVAVLGAGPMGLAVAFELLKSGYSVDIFERDDRIGGMSASTMLDGLKIERFYHFICKPDQTLFDYLDELGIADRLRWKETTMGFYYNGRLYDWGNPVALLRFPGLDWLTKVRYGLHVLYTKGVSDWSDLDRIPCTDWLRKWVGERGYEVLWKRLFELKFFEYKDDLSAAWLGTRIKRVALSRKNAFVERLGYLEGGSDTLLDALDTSIRRLGGHIRLKTAVDEIIVSSSDSSVVGLRAGGEVTAYDDVVSTIPLPYLVRLAPGLPPNEREKIAAIVNIGVVCVVLKLSHPISANFWTNINDDAIDIPGVIEYTNLYRMPVNVLYAPFYMPTSNPRYKRPSSEFIAEVTGYLGRLNSAFRPDWILAAQASRYEFAQTVCTPNFYEKLPAVRSAVKGLYMADTSHYYPEDRSISESMRQGRLLAQIVLDASA